jgi:nicotinamidase-related amidase
MRGWAGDESRRRETPVEGDAPAAAVLLFSVQAREGPAQRARPEGGTTVLLKRDDAVLVVIDVQERLLPFIHESELTVRSVVRLVRGFHILGLPILVTEQYRKGIGPTDARVIDALVRPESVDEPLPPVYASDADRPEPQAPPVVPAVRESFQPLEKMTFSCAEHPPFMEALRATGRRQVLLCGIESHVCVLQTALQLIERGFDVFLAADAVSSRSPRNVEIALRRMEREGVHLTSVEAGVFEMMHVSGTPEFKRWSRQIR